MKRHKNLLLLLCVLFSAFSVSCRDAAKPAGEIGTFNMGEKAQVGQLIYTVIDSKWAFSLGDPITPRVPTNRFFIINVGIVNSGSQPVSVPAFSLLDDSGQTYQELDNGTGVENWLGVIRKVNGTASSQGAIVFDAPQKRFRLKVSDEDDKYAYINIPLSLGEATPDLNPHSSIK